MGNKFFDKIFLILAITLAIFIATKIYLNYFSDSDKSLSSESNQNAKIVIYSKSGCIYCIKAKELLERKELGYKVVDLSNSRDLHLKLSHQTGQTTVPYVFIEDQFIGGFTELQNLESEGKL